jgi:hypothetical protein
MHHTPGVAQYLIGLLVPREHNKTLTVLLPGQVPPASVSRSSRCER